MRVKEKAEYSREYYNVKDEAWTACVYVYYIYVCVSVCLSRKKKIDSNEGRKREWHSRYTLPRLVRSINVNYSREISSTTIKIKWNLRWNIHNSCIRCQYKIFKCKL